MTLALGFVVALLIALPHVLRLQHAPPGPAAVVWLAALVLRALTAVFAAIAIILVLPTTRLFDLVTHWCWHAVVPVVTTHLGLDGHELGDAALILPALLLTASLIWVAFGLWRAARAVARLLQRAAVGAGPRGSVIVGDGDVVVAAAGLRHPRVLVSAGALTSFDDEELAASLDHERGHIERHHRYILVAAELCRALGRFLPGTRSAARELAFHLERDADRFAITRQHSPFALASAICKAAQGGPVPPMATALGGRGVTGRVRELLEGAHSLPGRRVLGLRALATGMVALCIAMSAALPAATVAAFDGGSASSVVRHCRG